MRELIYILVNVDSDRQYVQLSASLNNTTGNFAAVGD
jgi:hypothetical protein